MPHKRAKAVGKLLFFDKKTTPRSIDRFGFIPNYWLILDSNENISVLHSCDCDKSAIFAKDFKKIELMRAAATRGVKAEANTFNGRLIY